MHRLIWIPLILAVACGPTNPEDPGPVSGDLTELERAALEQQLSYELATLYEQSKSPVYVETMIGTRPAGEVTLVRRMPFAWPGVTSSMLCESCQQGAQTLDAGLLLGGTFAPAVTYESSWDGGELSMTSEMHGLPSSWLSDGASWSEDYAPINRALIHIERHIEQVDQALIAETTRVQVRRTAAKSFSIILADASIQMSHSDVGEITFDGMSDDVETVHYAATFDAMRDLLIEAMFDIDSTGAIEGAVHLGDQELAAIGGSAVQAQPLSFEWRSAAATTVNDACVPDCSARTCGLELSCGKSCGTCAANQVCSPDGRCIGSCVADCSDRVCGDDGCGGSCGNCAAGWGQSINCVDGQCVEE
ncbi:hypothetical protein ACFL6C_10335 [Myxococcota bacterium]